MKKLIVSLLMISIVLSVFAGFACANEGITIYVNETILQCDTAPFIHNGRTMVPMRKIFEAFGAQVDWNEETRTVTANTGAAEIKLTIDDNTLYNNGTAETMDVAPMIVNDRTFVPVRAISQSLGLPVEWYETTKGVFINSPMTLAVIKEMYPTEAELDGKIVISVNGTEYSQADYNLTYMSIYQNMAQQYAMYLGEAWEQMEVENGKTMLDVIEENTIEQTKQMYAISQIAEEKGIIADRDIQKEVDEQVKNLIESLGGDAQFKTFLTGMRTTEKALRRYYEFYSIFERLKEKLVQPGQDADVDAEILQKEFKENYWTVQHILISTGERTDEDAMAIVNEIYKKLKGGTEFGTLIEEYSEDPGLATKEDFYTFSAGRMVPEFEEESKSLAVGEYSREAVKTDYGYHIVKKYETDLNSQEFEFFAANKQQEIIFEMVKKKVASFTFEIK